MCLSRANHGKINRLHERCLLRIIYSNKTSLFEVLLEKDGSVSIHNRNLQLLAIEMDNPSNRLSLTVVTELFEKKNERQYILRHNSQFTVPPVNSFIMGKRFIPGF